MDPRAFGGKPPMAAPSPVVPPVAPMPADGLACPHCAKPVMLQKPPMGPVDAPSKPAMKADKPSKSDKKDAPKAGAKDKPFKKHNAASAPMDELKEVLKAGKPNDGE